MHNLQHSCPGHLCLGMNVAENTKDLVTLLWPVQRCSGQIIPSRLKYGLRKQGMNLLDVTTKSIFFGLVPHSEGPVPLIWDRYTGNWFIYGHFSPEGFIWPEQRCTGQSNVTRSFVFFATFMPRHRCPGHDCCKKYKGNCNAATN